MKKQNKTLKCVLNLNADFVDDIGINQGDVIWGLFKEAIDYQLKDKKRRISKAKNPIKLSIEIKTAKL